MYNYLLFRLFKVSFDEFPHINGKVKLTGRGVVIFGKNVFINSGKEYNTIGGDTVFRLKTTNKNALISIGNNVGISNSTIICSNSIVIEDYVIIGGSCKIYDTDFHSIDYTERINALKNNILDQKAKTAPITIKSGAWIGGHCIILKGSTIGMNSIIGAGSIVSKNIPDNEIWAGNPVSFIKKINP